MFSGSFFPSRYFARVYFPGGFPSKVRYFVHSYFSQRFYPDRYFPGPMPVVAVEPPVTPPTVTTFVGGGPAPRIIPVIQLIADLVIPTPILQGFGFVTSGNVEARADLQIPALVFSVGWQVQSDAQPIGTSSQFMVPELAFTATATSSYPRKRQRTKAQDEAEEQALMEHYMLTLALIRKGK